MQDLKKVFKTSGKTSAVIFIYGVIVQSNIVYLGMFLGSLISILSLYMMAIDAKKIIYSSNPKKIMLLGYLKRYAIYLFFLGVMVKLWGLPMLIGSAIGLLNTKFNIYFLTFSENIYKLKKKYFR